MTIAAKHKGADPERLFRYRVLSKEAHYRGEAPKEGVLVDSSTRMAIYRAHRAAGYASGTELWSITVYEGIERMDQGVIHTDEIKRWEYAGKYKSMEAARAENGNRRLTHSDLVEIVRE